jgi:translation initiation factor 1
MPAAPAPKPEKKKLRPDVIKLRREKRNGREVIVIDGLPADVVIDDYAKALKSMCGSGGTVKGRTIEIQGDHREKIEAFLLEKGFRSKRAGG